MGAIPSPRRSISNWFHTAFSRLMGVILSTKQKRLIVLARVWINLRKKQMQNVMDLLKDDALYECVDNVHSKDGAFELPFRLYKSLWGDDEALHPEAVKDEQAFKEELEKIYETIPPCLRYGRRSDLEEDVRRLYQRAFNYA